MPKNQHPCALSATIARNAAPMLGFAKIGGTPKNQVSTLVTVDANGTFIHSNKNNDLYRAASWRPFIARRMVASGRMIGQVKLSREAPSFVAQGAHPVVIFLHTI